MNNNYNDNNYSSVFYLVTQPNEIHSRLMYLKSGECTHALVEQTDPHTRT